MSARAEYTAIPIESDDEPVPISDKARGKQRASFSDPPDVPLAHEFYVNLRFTHLAQDVLAFPLLPTQTVREIKQDVAALRPPLAHKRLRFIYAGRILTDGIILRPWLESLLLRQKQAYNTSLLDAAEAVVKTTLEGSRPWAGQTPETAVWINCSVADVDADPAPASEEVDEEPMPEPEVRRGFDRLRDAGFSAVDIEAMRAQFRTQLADAHLETSNVVDDQDEHTRALEDSWLEGTGTTDPVTDTDDYMSLLKGLCIGFFFPIAPVFYFKTDLFSKHVQMGIVVGNIFNFWFAVVRWLS